MHLCKLTFANHLDDVVFLLQFCLYYLVAQLLYPLHYNSFIVMVKLDYVELHQQLKAVNVVPEHEKFLT